MDSVLPQYFQLAALSFKFSSIVAHTSMGLWLNMVGVLAPVCPCPVLGLETPHASIEVADEAALCCAHRHAGRGDWD